MTEREILMNVIKRLNLKVYTDLDGYIEFEPSFSDGIISAGFDDIGNIVDLDICH